MKAYDLAGKRFGRLVVLEAAVVAPGARTRWRCACDCGREKVISTTQLVGGRCHSCGCLRGEAKKLHGHARKANQSKTYSKWSGMKRRCDNPREVSYPRYGGRGITYDPRWANFQAFLEDMGECPPGMSLDRIDVNGDYTKDNCRWIPMNDQASNRRDTVYAEYQGERRTLGEWAKITGLKRATLLWRLRRLGWTVAQAIETPVGAEEDLVTYNGRTQSIATWARELGMDYMTLYQRLKRYNWETERAFATPIKRRG